MLSVIIVNWNTRELLAKCLRSILEHPPSEKYEVIVVDNASNDDSAAMVRDDFPWVRLVASARNTGYAAGNNLAFSCASGDLLLTLNPDTELRDGSLDTAIDFMKMETGIGCVSIRLVGPAGETQKSVRGFPTIAGIIGDISGLGSRFPGSVWNSYRMSSFDYNKSSWAPQPMGTFLLFRRSALEAVGDPRRPFDETFPIFFNEVDLLYRLDRAGWKCWYLHTAEILHYGGESTKQVRKSMIWESHRSLLRYLRKHQMVGSAKIALPLLAAIIYAAAFVRAKGYDVGFRP